MDKKLNYFCAVALFVACASAVFAKPDGFNLRGVVVDQTGAPIPDAQVSLHSSPALLAQATTGPAGEFSFTDLTVNRGMLRVRATGFAEVERHWIAMDQQTAALRIVLAPLPLKELVVVTAARTNTRLA